MPGPRPTPTHLKVLRGNPGKQALNKNEPQPKMPARIPEPPAFLEAYAVEEWKRVAPELHELGLLTNVDVAALGAYCQAYATWKNATEAHAFFANSDKTTRGLVAPTPTGRAMRTALAVTIREAAADVVRFGSEFGLTPASRSRITARAEDKPASKFGKLIAG